MPRVSFTSHLQRYADPRPVEVDGDTVRDALEAALSQQPRLRGYVFDDQNRLRRHLMVFVDGHTINDPLGLSDNVAAESEIFLMQALSGG